MKQTRLLINLLLSLLLLPLLSRAQISVTSGAGVTATVLVNKLTGAGVTVLNPTLTCNQNAKGTFGGVPPITNLSFDSGIVLSTGRAIDAARPANNFSSTANNTPGDPQLTTLAGNPTYDACILQFDFRPAGDTIKFDYVFGSEEYTGYTCSNYNDVFAFFISGPGIAGTQNLAVVPGTNIPVCVNSVNSGTPSAGYSINTCRATGTGAPFTAYYVNNNGGNRISYDGLTRTLTAISRVTPCDTYHLKIGIADANDDIYDSGVFLKAGSLRSKTFTSSAQGVNPTDTGFGSQYTIRGCTPGMFIFRNTGSLTDSIIVKYIIAGTGVNGIDYAPILDSTIIHVGQATDTVFIYGLTSTTGIKTVKLYVLAPFSCGTTGPTIMDSVQLTIYDSFYVKITTPPTAVCIGQNVQLNAAGASNLNYSWAPSASLNNPNIQNPIATPPLGTTTYTVTAGLPGCPPSHDVVNITAVPPPPPPTVTNHNYCKGDPPSPFNISGAGTVYWYPSSVLAGGTVVTPTVTTSAAGTYTFYFNQAVGSCQSPVDSITIIVYPEAIADFSVNLDRGCYGDNISIEDHTSNGVAYLWNFGDGATATTTTPFHTYDRNNGIGGIYTVLLTVRSADNCVDTQTVQVDTRHDVTASFTIPDNIICAVNPSESISVTNTSSAYVSYLPPNLTTITPVDADSLHYEWNWGDGSPVENGTTPASSPHSYPQANYYNITLTVTDTIGCKATFSLPITSQRVDITAWTDSTLCLREPMALRSTITSFPITSSPDEYTYTWVESSPNLDDPTAHEPHLTGFGDFIDEVTAVHGGTDWNCYATHTYTIHSVLGQVLTNVTPDAVIPYGSSVQLNANNEVYYHWTPNDGSIDNPNINNPNAAPLQTTTYTVFGMDKYGCVDSAFVTIRVDSNLNEAIPSAFTPNGDGLNDVFRPIGLKAHERLVEFRVYNRYGQQVYYTRNAGEGWDGTLNGVPQDLGVYHYQYIASHPDGTNRKYKGDVTLIR